MISPNVAIMTKMELSLKEDAAFARGAKHGKFEAEAGKLPSLLKSRAQAWADTVRPIVDLIDNGEMSLLDEPVINALAELDMTELLAFLDTLASKKEEG